MEKSFATNVIILIIIIIIIEEEEEEETLFVNGMVTVGAV